MRSCLQGSIKQIRCPSESSVCLRVLSPTEEAWVDGSWAILRLRLSGTRLIWASSGMLRRDWSRRDDMRDGSREELFLFLQKQSQYGRRRHIQEATYRSQHLDLL